LREKNQRSDRELVRQHAGLLKARWKKARCVPIWDGDGPTRRLWGTAASRPHLLRVRCCAAQTLRLFRRPRLWDRRSDVRAGPSGR